MEMRDVRYNAKTYGFYKMENRNNSKQRFFIHSVVKSITDKSKMLYSHEITIRQGRKLEDEGVIAELWPWA